MQQCPNCKSRSIHRSHSRGRWEQWRKHVYEQASVSLLEMWLARMGNGLRSDLFA